MVDDTYREKKLTRLTVGSRSFLKLERVDFESVAYRKLFQAGGDSAGNDAYDRGWIDSGHLFDTPYDVIVHQCNCWSASGSRIANAILRSIPKQMRIRTRKLMWTKWEVFRSCPPVCLREARSSSRWWDRLCSDAFGSV